MYTLLYFFFCLSFIDLCAKRSHLFAIFQRARSLLKTTLSLIEWLRQRFKRLLAQPVPPFSNPHPCPGAQPQLRMLSKSIVGVCKCEWERERECAWQSLRSAQKLNVFSFFHANGPNYNSRESEKDVTFSRLLPLSLSHYRCRKCFMPNFLFST